MRATNFGLGDNIYVRMRVVRVDYVNDIVELAIPKYSTSLCNNTDTIQVIGNTIKKINNMLLPMVDLTKVK